MRTILPFLSLLPFFLATPLSAQDWLNMGSSKGSNARDLHGWSVAPIADFDGDGLDEILIGAIGEDTNGSNCGSVSIVDGTDGTVHLQVFGEKVGSLLGVSVVALPDLDGGGKPEFAAGAPWHSGAGFFAGRVYLFRGEDGVAIDAIEGAAGEILGASLAAVDWDNDGITELLIGVLGASSSAGEVRMYQFDGSALVLENTIAGDTAGDWLGYSLATVRDPLDQPSGLFLVGVPFVDQDASTLNSGGAYLYLSTPAAAFVRFREYLGSTAGAGLGYSVDGRLPTLVSALIAAGGPLANGPAGTNAGEVVVWDETISGRTTTQIDGATAGDRLGVATLILDDVNFDGQLNLLTSAPYATGQAGRVEILNLQHSPPAVVRSFDGTTGERLGWSAAHLGDLNGSTFHDLALGAPRTSSTLGYQGSVQLWSPPDSNLDDPVITLLDPVTRGADLNIQVSNIKEGADVYFYLGTTQTPTTSLEGFDLDIGNLRGDGLGNDYQVLDSGVTGGTANATLFIPPSSPPGATFYFQIGEERGGFMRTSDVTSGVVQDQDQTLSFSGDLIATQTKDLDVAFGLMNQNIHFFASDSAGSDGYFTIINNTGLSNPSFVGQSVTDANGSGTLAWTVPTVPPGIEIFLSVVSWDGFGIEKLAVIGPFPVL